MHFFIYTLFGNDPVEIYVILGIVIFLILLGLLLFVVLKKILKNRTYPKHSDSSRDSLEEEYARGDISEEEYERKKQKLS
ncbi:MAG: SHOCT domain-containing protein [Alkalibacterium sp.]|nr:SHOCT domain-containing protein [Alkalibacterium sp.]TVP89754.1 MAG: hypothetical protein EA249_08690 [Alkalibacterium sp.]